MKDTTADSNTVVRKDLENSVFGDWKNSKTETERTIAEFELRELLVNHAKTVMFSIIRRNDPLLADEAANRVLVSLPTFRGESLFTTWAHRIITGVMYNQRRTDRQRKEISMTDIVGFDLPGDMTAAMTDLLLTVQNLLTEEDYSVFSQIVLLGSSHAETAQNLGLSRTAVGRRWEKITGVLKNAFAK